jgi:hypothetical protein
MKKLDLFKLENLQGGGNGRECMIYGGLAPVALFLGTPGVLSALGLAAYANNKGCFSDRAR